MAFELLLDRGPLTRRQLRSLTGLSGPTVADLVQRLEAAGLVAPVGEAGTERRGPNATLYGVLAERAHVAGVEVRPDRVIAVVTDVTGAPVGVSEVAQDPRIAPHQLVCAAIDGALADAGLAPDQLRMVVVGTPGLVDPASGDVTFVASLPTWHANLLPGLRERYGDRVLLENEVNLVGLAEHRLGAARGRDTFALLSLSTGIGVAIVLGGRLHRGASGGAGEASYIPLGALGSGTFQDHAGGDAIVALAREHCLDDPDGGLGALVSAAVADGPRHEAFLDAIADRISVGAVAICAVLDPGVVVLAGEVGLAGGADLACRVAERLAARIPLPTEVVPGAVGVGGWGVPEGGVVGPGDEARSAVDGNPVVRGAVLVALDLLHQETFGEPAGGR
ncbi:ROK family transcriptional regulator [Actinopolymorpha alba]|uniref:ROK family transcriptional regulator n=1 Tax=Actinopolymorpha alba TaxID=533267 RepID=UPI000361106A|nr:ROK family transcriptional regulator [Actinopolymorpha alba]